MPALTLAPRVRSFSRFLALHTRRMHFSGTIDIILPLLLAAGRPIFVADAKGSTTELPKGVLVLGSEGQGVSPALRKAGRAIAIETSGRVESLNVAAAAAILLWRTFVKP